MWPIDRPTHWVGRAQELAVLRAGAEALRRGDGSVVWVEGEPGIGKSSLVAEALADVGDPEWYVGWGQALYESMPGALRTALHADAAQELAASGWEALTPTEVTIAALVARGDSTPDIARGMFLSRRTVQSHMSHILAKLGAKGRADIVREALRRASRPDGDSHNMSCERCYQCTGLVRQRYQARTFVMGEQDDATFRYCHWNRGRTCDDRHTGAFPGRVGIRRCRRVQRHWHVGYRPCMPSRAIRQLRRR